MQLSKWLIVSLKVYSWKGRDLIRTVNAETTSTIGSSITLSIPYSVGKAKIKPLSKLDTLVATAKLIDAMYSSTLPWPSIWFHTLVNMTHIGCSRTRSEQNDCTVPSYLSDSKTPTARWRLQLPKRFSTFVWKDMVSRFGRMNCEMDVYVLRWWANSYNEAEFLNKCLNMLQLCRFRVENIKTLKIFGGSRITFHDMVFILMDLKLG